MHILSSIGEEDYSIHYTDRPTVKVVVIHGNKVLLINAGLLPGGGVHPGESNEEAITRELQEELGMTVKDMQTIGTVVQYRNLLSKKYSIHGYTALLDTSGGPTSPQDEGEAQFTGEWLSLGDATARTALSVEEARLKPMNDDANQGRLYNLMTTGVFLEVLVGLPRRATQASKHTQHP